jgi:O-antigen/teichoic acid export membrane protein
VISDAAIDFRADVLPPQVLKRTIANLGSVVGGEALLRLGSFLAAVIIARNYGSAVFGVYAAALAYVTVVSMLADNGLQTAAIQQISRSPADLAAIASRLYVAKTSLLFPAVLLLAGVTVLLHWPDLVEQIVLLVALRTLLQSYAQLHIAMLKAIHRMHAIGIVQSVHFTFLIAGILWCYRGAHSITFLLAVMVAGQAVEFLGSAFVLSNYGLRAVRVRVEECWKLVRLAAPMGAANTMASIALRGDVVLLSWMVPATALGHFAAAQSLLVLLSVGSWLLGSVLLADMARLAHDYDALQYYVARWSRRIAMLLVPAAIVAVWAAPAAVRAIFGEAFGKAGGIVVILAMAAPFLFLNALYLNRAIALDLRSAYVGAYAAALSFGLLVGFILVRSFGATGVAVAAVAREIFLFTVLRTFAARPRQVTA